jgi:hypothetical protein
LVTVPPAAASGAAALASPFAGLPHVAAAAPAAAAAAGPSTSQQPPRPTITLTLQKTKSTGRRKRKACRYGLTDLHATLHATDLLLLVVGFLSPAALKMTTATHP